MLESIQDWRKKWFYVRDEPIEGLASGLPKFLAEAVVKNKRSWQNKLSGPEEAEVNELMKHVMALQSTVGEEVSEVQIIRTFIRRRVQPLQARVHAMWQYTGASDPTRTHNEELSTNELQKSVRALTTLTTEDVFLGEPPIAPYGESKKLPKVNLSSFFFDRCRICSDG